jgi:DNA-binding CsgD family transcriptional regulator
LHALGPVASRPAWKIDPGTTSTGVNTGANAAVRLGAHADPLAPSNLSARRRVRLAGYRDRVTRQGSASFATARGGLLLEREGELASLEALIDEAAAGEARLALIEGPAGIGKTRLVAEARRRAAEKGFQVLGAQGGELERGFPFGVVRQLFEPAVVADEAQALAGAAGPARAVFESAHERAEGGPVGDPSFASLHGLYWVTLNLSERGPLMLAVDDLHWCDPPSLRFLAYLRRRLEGLPLLLACSLRPSQLEENRTLLGEVTGDPLTVVIRPRPLSGPAVADLVRERLREVADDAFSAACHTATGGNPLLLGELLKVLEAEQVSPDRAHVGLVADVGPRAASRAVLLRLGRLSEDAGTVARALAALGDGADLSAVAALADLDEARAGSAVAALVGAEIVRANSPLGFVHPLVGAAIREDVPPGERELQHGRAARLLADAGAPVEQVVAHLRATPARGEAWVVETLRRAATAARRKGAADSAVAYLARALAEPPPPDQRPELLLELGLAEALTSGPAAAEHLREAYEALSDRRARAMAAQVLGRALLFTGFPEEGAGVVRRATAELPPELEDVRKALEAFELFSVLFGAGDRVELRRLEHYRALPPGAGVGAKMLAAIAAQEWMYAGGPGNACVELSLAALAGGDLIAADNGLLATVAITNLVFADREEAVDWWEVARTDAYRRGSLFAISSLSLWWGFTQYRRGELREAEESLRAALGEFELWGYGEQQAQIYCDAFLAAVLRERGDLDGARRALERSVDPGGEDDGARYWLNSRLELLIAERRFDEALAAADDYARRFDHIVRNPFDAPWRSHKALALAGLGRHEEGLPLVEEELQRARAWGAPGTVARTLRVLGVLERDGGLDHLEEAVDVVVPSPARLEQAKALVALGIALRHARRPTDARAPLRRALELADVCGASTLADQARSELHAAGGRPRTSALSGVESLTPSESRIAKLAADGHTNRDIAQELFVTPKTVERHLGSVYRKLGVRSRHELGSVLELHPEGAPRE